MLRRLCRRWLQRPTFQESQTELLARLHSLGVVAAIACGNYVVPLIASTPRQWDHVLYLKHTITATVGAAMFVAFKYLCPLLAGKVVRN
jgi:hypothetical protein